MDKPRRGDTKPIVPFVSPLRGSSLAIRLFPGFTPWATLFRPYGALVRSLLTTDYSLLATRYSSPSEARHPLAQLHRPRVGGRHLHLAEAPATHVVSQAGRERLARLARGQSQVEHLRVLLL